MINYSLLENMADEIGRSSKVIRDLPVNLQEQNIDLLRGMVYDYASYLTHASIFLRDGLKAMDKFWEQVSE